MRTRLAGQVVALLIFCSAGAARAVEIDELMAQGPPGVGRYHRFDKFTFDLEGLKATGGAGSLQAVSLDGKVARLTIYAPDLSWEYVPPGERDRRFFDLHRKVHEDDFAFKPTVAHLRCDPGSCERLMATSFAGLRESAELQVDEALKKLVEKSETERAKRERQERVRTEPPPWDGIHRWVTAVFLRENPQRYVWLDFDDREAREVVVGITDTMWMTYYGEQTRVGGSRLDELEKRPDATRRDYDVEAVVGSVSLGIDESELLKGDLTFTLKAKRDLKWVPFTLASTGRIWSVFKRAHGPRLSVFSITDAADRSLKIYRTGTVSGVAELEQPVRAGDTLSLRMRYESRDAIVKESGAFSYVDRDGWLPFIHYGDKIPKFELTVRVPAKYTTYSVGKKVSGTTQGDVSISKWVAETPVTFPTVIYGSYKDYDGEVKAKKLSGDTIPVTVHFDTDTVAIMPSMRGAPAAANAAANALNLYRDVFGVDYPFARLDLMNAPQGFLGQSPDAIIYLGDPTFLSEGRLGMELGGEATRFVSGLVPHEVAHQWWGSLIAPANDASYWFVESLAEYSSALFMEATRGRKGYEDQLEAWRHDTLTRENWNSVQSGEGTYDRGAYAFHILRCTFGDEAFFKFLKALATQLQGKEITTRDIQDVAQKAFGADVGWFFEQWIRGVGTPEFTFSYKTRKAEDGSHILSGRIDQRVMVTTKHPQREVLDGVAFKGVGVISLTGKSGKEYTKKMFVGPTATFEVKLPEEAKQVVFNKHGEILAYDIIVKEEK